MEDMLEKNMGLVIKVVNNFHPKNHTEREDFIQAGRIGLWKALQKYCPERGTKFSPYAWNPIKWEIIKEIRSFMKHKKVQSPLNMDQESFSYEEAELFWELVPSNLTEEEELVIKLRLDGFNFKEISEQLDCHRSRTKKLYNSAIQKIRDQNGS